MPNKTFSVSRRTLGAFAVLFTATLTLPTAARTQEVAVTFDDLPNHGPLPAGETREDVARKILAALRAAKVPEVYGFINAGKIPDHSGDIEVLRLWRAAGQPLGNHTFAHISLNNNTLVAFEENIARDEPTLQSLMGKKDWHWFRYPYLDEGDTLEKRRGARAYLQDHHYRIAQVTLDFQDYAWNPAYARCLETRDDKTIAWLRESYLSTATEYMKLGRQLSQQIFHRDIKYILLMHIGAFDAEMLPQLLAQMKQQGFKFIKLRQAEDDPAYDTDPDATFKDGGTLLDQIMEVRQLQYPPHAEKPMQELEAACKR